MQEQFGEQCAIKKKERKKKKLPQQLQNVHLLPEIWYSQFKK